MLQDLNTSVDSLLITNKIRYVIKKIATITAKERVLGSSCRKDQVSTYYPISRTDYNYKTWTGYMKKQFEDSE